MYIQSKHKLFMKHGFAISMVLILMITMLTTKELIYKSYTIISMTTIVVLLISIHMKSEKKHLLITYLMFVFSNSSVVLTYVYNKEIGITPIIYCQMMILILYPLTRDKLFRVYVPNALMYLVLALFTRNIPLLLEGLVLFSFIYLYVMLNNKRIIKIESQLKNCQRRLNDYGLIDSLSGLYNNAYVFEYLRDRLSHINHGELSVLMMDIDNFKRINDTYGHIYGDQVIKKIAELLRECTSVDDVLGRYGGEEFIVILNNADFERSIDVAEDIRTKIEKLEVKSDTLVTISIGIAFYNNDTAENLIKRADDQLYHAKKLGKNRVEGKKEVL